MQQVLDEERREQAYVLLKALEYHALITTPTAKNTLQIKQIQVENIFNLLVQSREKRLLTEKEKQSLKLINDRLKERHMKRLRGEKVNNQWLSELVQLQQNSTQT